jgi:hypothetical protein
MYYCANSKVGQAIHPAIWMIVYYFVERQIPMGKLHIINLARKTAEATGANSEETSLIMVKQFVEHVANEHAYKFDAKPAQVTT